MQKEIQDYMEHKKNTKDTYNMARCIHQYQAGEECDDDEEGDDDCFEMN